MNSNHNSCSASDNSVSAAASSQDVWAAERSLIVERLAECVRSSGQPRAPRLSFDGAKVRGHVPSARGHETSGMMAYRWREDTVVADLEALFGSPGITSLEDAGVIAATDGCLLHELGHRRDRWAEAAVRSGWVLAVAVLGVGWVVGQLVGREGIAMISGAVALGLFLVWCAVSVPGRRRQERRADAYMADVGGPEICEAFLSVVTRTFSRDADTLRIYDDPQVRRRRIERRVDRRRPPA